MTRNGRKRSRQEYEHDHRLGVGETLSHMNGSTDEPGLDHGEKDRVDDEGWQYVDGDRSRNRKKSPRTDKQNYPSISHSSHSRLQSFVKLGDLQNLILYLLADGSGPHWCAARNHANVRKVVALMVPGLEAGMFDGTMPLTEPQEKDPEPNGGTTAPSSLELAQSKNETQTSKDAFQRAPSQADDPGKTLISPDDYYPSKLKRSRLPEALHPLCAMFDHIWPIRTPGDDKYAKMHSRLAAMLIAPIMRPKEDKKMKGPQPPSAGRDWKNERTPITEYIASTDELTEEGYVLHPAHYAGSMMAPNEIAKRELNKTTVQDGWVDAINIPKLASGEVPEQDVEMGSILAGRKVLAMDCEMCITSPAGTTPAIFSLTRISIIEWDGKVILDQLVKPEQPITDYLTPYSGITASMLQDVTTCLQDIQQKLVNEVLTPQTILIGHSLNSDLNALQLTHPFIIDTALLFPHPRGPPLKSSLKWLAQKYLSREIQKGHGSTGHDSVEDARACLDLVKQKCEKGKAWGTSEASGESIFKRLSRSVRPRRMKVNAVGEDEPRTGAVVDWGQPVRGYGAQARVAIGCETDEDVVSGVKRAVHGDEDASIVPKEGVDFVFARLRELEAHQGWWNRSRVLDNETLLNNATTNAKTISLASVTAQTISHVQDIWDFLPPCTAFVIFSGSGDPRELSEMQTLKQQFKDEYKVKKWDELTVRWTDDEEQRLRRACEKARRGIAFMTVK